MSKKVYRDCVRRRNSGPIAVTAGLLLFATAIPAGASTAGLAVLGEAPRLDDTELGEMRGKFVKPDSVSFFGISMVTNWQDENGITTLARLIFNVDFLSSPDSGGPVPHLMIAWSREGDPGMDVTENHEGYMPYISPEQVLPIGGLGSFSGAAQANVIAGADNRALNGLHVAIVPSSAVTGAGAASVLATPGVTSHRFDDGDELQFRVVDNQIGIVMTGNGGLDSSTQMIGGDIGQVLQQTILNSDQNNVVNNTSVIFGVDALQNLDVVRAQEALSAMKGHGF